jgi:hypothetical protein
MQFKNLIFLFFVITCNLGICQSQYKNELLDSSNIRSTIAWNLQIANNKYIITSDGFIDGFQNQGLSLFFVEQSLGSFTKKNYFYQYKTLLYGSSNINKDSSKIIITGGEFRTGSLNKNSFVFMFNTQGDSLKYLTIGDSVYAWRIINSIECNNGELILVGGRSKFPLNNPNTYDEYPLAMKIDSMGNVLWTQLYQFTNRGLNLGIQKTLDGNFLINSYTSVPGGVGVVFTPTLIKIDTLGNMLWYRKYGVLDRDNNSFTNLLEDQDGNLSCLTSFKNSANLNDDSMSSYFFKLSPTGEILSQKILTSFDKSQAISSLIKAGNNYWAAGSQTFPNSIERNGFISNYDLEGNIIKNREYQFYEDIVGFNHLYKIVFTPQDSGFICIGYTQYVSQDSASNQHAWLLKTDKYGCIVQDCQLTGLEEIQELQELNVFPNPSQNVFYINASQEIKNVSVFTINGKRILQDNLNSTFSRIDLTDFSSGIYFVEVQTEKGEMIRRKLVKVE